MHSVLNTYSCHWERGGSVWIRTEVSWGTFKAFPGRTQSLWFPLSLSPTPAKAVTLSILVSGKQVALHSEVAVPGDQDVEEEAKMIETYLEKLCKKNPLVLKELSKVKSDVA